jgi:hypothetical protein
MTFQESITTDVKVRPERVRFLAELPRDLYEQLDTELRTIPDWDRFFIMNNPSGWPQVMRSVVEHCLQDKIEFSVM